jgi:DNA-binding NtrC family response regulator
MPKSPTPELDALIASQPDLVDRIFDYLIELRPELASWSELEAAKLQVRDEFGGEKQYARTNSARKTAQRVRDVLSLYNGRNAAEIARKLQIGRSTVYLYLKQAGYRRIETLSKDSLEIGQQPSEDRRAQLPTLAKD